MSTSSYRWLVLKLEAPLVSFGGIVIDSIGVTRDFPATSMITGLIANALGFERTEWKKHQQLQDRIIFASCFCQEMAKGILTDTQNAKLEKNDKGWTTYGIVESRDGGSYNAPHRRKRDFHMDMHMTLVLRLSSAQESPTLTDVAHALDYPARPLFLGRKPCLPARPLLAAEEKDRYVYFDTAYEAILATLGEEHKNKDIRALWPVTDGPNTGTNVNRVISLADMKNWRIGLHVGTRSVVEGYLV